MRRAHGLIILAFVAVFPAGITASTDLLASPMMGMGHSPRMEPKSSLSLVGQVWMRYL